jgi:hypothetical protein
MKKSIFCVLSVAAVMGAALTSTAASAAVMAPGPPVPTTVTFTVTSGLLTLSAPGSAALGTSRPASTITGALGLVTVTDDRALLAAAWTVSASSTDFTTGTGASLSVIPVADADYDPHQIATTGTITATATTITLSGTPATVVAGTAGTGNNTASWNPTMSIDVPPDAVGGDYTGTLTQSVS